MDIDAIKLANDEKEGFRKNSFLVHQGKNKSKKEIKRLRASNKDKYGLSRTYCMEIKVPKLLDHEVTPHYRLNTIKTEKLGFSLMERIYHTKKLIQALNEKLEIISKVENKIAENIGFTDDIEIRLNQNDVIEEHAGNKIVLNLKKLNEK